MKSQLDTIFLFFVRFLFLVPKSNLSSFCKLTLSNTKRTGKYDHILQKTFIIKLRDPAIHSGRLFVIVIIELEKLLPVVTYYRSFGVTALRACVGGQIELIGRT